VDGDIVIIDNEGIFNNYPSLSNGFEKVIYEGWE